MRHAESGDAYVRACLEAIVADTSVLDARLSPRVGLYRLFHKLWNSAHVEVPGRGARSATPTVWSGRLSELTPARRQALLLTAMEGFNISDAAHILSVDEEEVKQMVSQAVREISNQPSTKVLIIEDEPIISLDLQSIVREMGHTVAAIATTRDEAVRAARKTEPGLVLADIKLADGSSGIDAVRSDSERGRSADRVHHRLSGASADRRTPGADLPGHQTVRAGNGARGGQPGAAVRLIDAAEVRKKTGPSGPVSFCSSRWSNRGPAAQRATHQCNQGQDQENKETDLRDTGRGAGNAGEAQHGGDDRDYKECQRPRQHVNLRTPR